MQKFDNINLMLSFNDKVCSKAISCIRKPVCHWKSLVLVTVGLSLEKWEMAWSICNDYSVSSHCRFSVMSVKREDVLKDENLIKNIEEIAKDTALIHGVLMRTRETPNSPEVRAHHWKKCPSHINKHCWSKPPNTPRTLFERTHLHPCIVFIIYRYGWAI